MKDLLIAKWSQIEGTIVTRREKEILNLISLGLSTNDIAVYLNISGSTVKTHRKHLLRKLGANNVAALVRVGMEYGLI
ncbi:MAG: LuxR C-terminal-related transcriptional regulator [Saprospiraceae bacterium]|nr:LuxR C-terminal-related transcriptional regulator [Saprospiraceae bacterium]